MQNGFPTFAILTGGYLHHEEKMIIAQIILTVIPFKLINSKPLSIKRTYLTSLHLNSELVWNVLSVQVNSISLWERGREIVAMETNFLDQLRSLHNN